MHTEFKMFDLLEKLKTEGITCENLEIKYLYDQKYLNSRFEKFSDIAETLEMDFQKYYSILYNFLIPIFYIIKNGYVTDAIWDNKAMKWNMILKQKNDF